MYSNTKVPKNPWSQKVSNQYLLMKISSLINKLDMWKHIAGCQQVGGRALEWAESWMLKVGCWMLKSNIGCWKVSASSELGYGSQQLLRNLNSAFVLFGYLLY